MSRRTFMLAAASVAMSFAQAAQAQSDKPISLVVGYSAGGSADFIARVVGEELSKRLGRQIIIENVAGASGMLALQKVLNGPPDGQLIYMGGTDTVVIPMVNRTFKHQWDRDLAPIGRMTTVPMIFAVPATSKFSNLSELLGDLQKSGSDRFSYATPGIGTMQHLYGALLNERAKTSMLHIPYRGGAQIVNDLVGHQVDSAVLVLSTAMPFLKDGKIKALSVSDAARVPSLPNVQRIGEEVGFNGLSLPLWQGLFVKAGTPREITSAYEKAMLEAVSVQSVKSKLAESGVTVSPLTGQQLTDFIRPQAKLYHDIVEAAKISLK